MSTPAPRPHRSRSLRRRIAVVLATTGLLALTSLTATPAPTEAVGTSLLRPLTVSLTFDDGNANQAAAGATLKKYGLKGTFFVNSGTIGAPGFMTWADLNTLKSQGNEIGGHTLSHPDLATIAPDEAKRQVCDDRAALTAKGFSVRSFAYPFASLTPALETIVKNCGYNSARALGDLAYPGDPDCVGCPSAAKLPPVDPFATQALPQVESSWTLNDLKGTVTRAEAAGGWLQLTFHNVCAATCELNVTPAVLDAFAKWLAPRVLMRTTVKTVGDVVGGAVKPVVRGPVAGPIGPGVNGVVNPGMEDVTADGSPRCWMKGGYGANTAVLGLGTPAHGGSRAGTLTMSGYSDGDAKWVQQFDLGACTPTVQAGRTYSLRQWYTSSAVTQFAVYLRDAAGVWHYWTSSPWFAASSSYTEAAWTTPAIPAGMTGISFGLNLFSNGTLVTDDAAIYDTVGAPAVAASAVEAPTPAQAPAVAPGVEPQGLTETHVD
ncbi:polysaccharide deacetylase family protein [Aeromicrobium sp. Leaf350]|uniref:polysaccharide deacetylase family protein n=1 Tax=Aeromicrobium sp. Leaf350 TaxID=2876565 RepID=UPI001E2B4952|nr:polysaccharide deacetylase family protein [Aeromicrobium sp. Leaf350]